MENGSRWWSVFKVYVFPFIHTPLGIKVGPGGKGIPIAEVTDEAGDHVQFSGDGKTVYWSLGADLFSCPIDEAMRELAAAPDSNKSDEGDSENASKANDQKPENDDVKEESTIVSQRSIGFSHPHARPDGIRAIVGGRVVTMGQAGVIENGVVLIDGNRISTSRHPRAGRDTR